MIFTDGVEVKTTGPYRIIREVDGLYVVGEGFMCAVDTQGEAEQLLRELLSQNAPPLSKIIRNHPRAATTVRVFLSQKG